MGIVKIIIYMEYNFIPESINTMEGMKIIKNFLIINKMNVIIKKLKNKENLTFEESKSAFESMMSGKLNEQQILIFNKYVFIKG